MDPNIAIQAAIYINIPLVSALLALVWSVSHRLTKVEVKLDYLMQRKDQSNEKT